jgi:hypothetical protein
MQLRGSTHANRRLCARKSGKHKREQHRSGHCNSLHNHQGSQRQSKRRVTVMVESAYA